MVKGVTKKSKFFSWILKELRRAWQGACHRAEIATNAPLCLPKSRKVLRA